MDLGRKTQPVGSPVLASPEHSPEGEGRGPAPGIHFLKHGVEHPEGLVGEALQHVPRDEAGPGNGVTLGHFVEHPACRGQAHALGVGIDKVVGEKEVMVEPSLDELDVEALRSGGIAAAAEQEEDVRVRVRGRRRGRTRIREPVGEEVTEWNRWREAARLWRGSGGGGGAECEVG